MEILLLVIHALGIVVVGCWFIGIATNKYPFSTKHSVTNRIVFSLILFAITLEYVFDTLKYLKLVLGIV